jgi:hypothetical protein
MSIAGSRTLMDYRNVVAVLVLIFYVPCFGICCTLTWRHGWWASWETWFVLATFSLTRTAYAAVQLSTSAHPDSVSLRVAAVTLSVDGLSPLFYSTLGLLHRLLDRLDKRAKCRLHLRHLRVIEIIVTAAFICASVGFSGISDEEVLSGDITHPPSARAAAILYMVGYAGILLAAIAMAEVRGRIEREEWRTLIVVVASQPLLFVRTLYLLLDILGGVRIFSALDGDATTFLCMALIEEALVAAGYVSVGWTLRVLANQEIRVVEEGGNLGTAVRMETRK